VIWIVRDSNDETGEPMPYVSVWHMTPKRWKFGEGHVWLSEFYDLRGWLGSLYLPDAHRILGTIPDDDRQVIVMGRNPQRIQKAIAKANEFRVPRPK
jgi:hypothetical protein